MKTTKIDDRTTAYLFKTAFLPKPVEVRVMVPVGYTSNPARRYPVLWLMHGATGAPSEWWDEIHAKKVIGNAPVIVVAPSITINRAENGWCTRWSDGSQDWEPFHIGQLLPWTDANLRTLPRRSERAIAGFSEGGFCAMSYGSRHPDLFGHAEAYSGVVETWYDPLVRVANIAHRSSMEINDRILPGTVWGNPLTDGAHWAAGDPGYLAENLRNTTLSFTWGDSVPRLNSLPTSPEGFAPYPVETLAALDNVFFKKRLADLGIPATYEVFPGGSHDYPYWERSLKAAMPRILKTFRTDAPAPTKFSYTSGENAFSVYGFGIKTVRNVQEFATLRVTSARAFSLEGSGKANLVTPAAFKPGSRHTVTFRSAGGSTNVVAVADGVGRLRFTVPLGPSNSSANPATSFLAVPGLNDPKTYLTNITIR